MEALRQNAVELVALLAEREGILMAESSNPGGQLIERWAAQLTDRQAALLNDYETLVDHYRVRYAADNSRLASDGGLH